MVWKNDKKVTDTLKDCEKCGKEIFFARNSNNKWVPFDAELSEVVPPNTIYCDGYGNVKRTGAKPGKKGYIIHFESCGKEKE